MRAIERRIRRLEQESRHRAEAGPSPAEVIRERRRKRLLAEGKEPEPPLPLIPRFDQWGRPRKISEIMREARERRRLAEEAAKT